MPTARGEFLTTCYDNGTIGRISADGKDLPPYTHDKDGNKFVGPERFRARRPRRHLLHTSGTRPAAIDGKVFYIAADGTITLEAGDVHNANGMAVSRDGKILYVIETEENRLIKFKIGADGVAVGPARFS